MTKALEAFRTISEVAEELDVQKHVLRFWELKFPQIRPMKRGGGRRYYRPEDMVLLHGIKALLHAEGYTIKGVQKILREQGIEQVKILGTAASEGRRLKSTAGTRSAKDKNAGGAVAAGRLRALPASMRLVKRGPADAASDGATLAAVIEQLKVCRERMAALGRPQLAVAPSAPPLATARIKLARSAR